MAKEAIYLVRHELDPGLAREWDGFHAREHVPRVMAAGGFLSAQRFRVEPAGSPARFVTLYRAATLAVIRGYLEGGKVGETRAQHDAWVEARNARVHITREILEENYSVDGEGKPLTRSPEMQGTTRAVFQVRVRIDPSAAPAWSTWYDRDHLPQVAREGFLRAGRWRVVDESAGRIAFVVLYEAGGRETLERFLEGKARQFGAEHQEKFGDLLHVEREVWVEAG